MGSVQRDKTKKRGQLFLFRFLHNFVDLAELILNIYILLRFDILVQTLCILRIHKKNFWKSDFLKGLNSKS